MDPWSKHGQLLLLVAASAAPVSGATREAALSLSDCQQQNCQLRKAHWSLGLTTNTVREKPEKKSWGGEVFSFIWNIGKTRHSANNSIVLKQVHKCQWVPAQVHFSFINSGKKERRKSQVKEEERKKERKEGWKEGLKKGGKEESIYLGLSLDIFNVDLDFSSTHRPESLHVSVHFTTSIST